MALRLLLEGEQRGQRTDHRVLALFVDELLTEKDGPTTFSINRQIIFDGPAQRLKERYVIRQRRRQSFGKTTSDVQSIDGRQFRVAQRRDLDQAGTFSNQALKVLGIVELKRRIPKYPDTCRRKGVGSRFSKTTPDPFSGAESRCLLRRALNGIKVHVLAGHVANSVDRAGQAVVFLGRYKTQVSFREELFTNSWDGPQDGQTTDLFN